MNILVTGNLGLIGSNFVKYLQNNKTNLFNIIGIDDLSGGMIENINNDITQYYVNLEDDNAVNYIFDKHKIDYVYHFAAYAAEGLSPFIRNFNYRNNLLSSVNIINACINFNIKKLIFTSSMAVYGSNQTPFFEDMIPSPEDPYGVAKYAVEQDIKTANHMFNLSYTIVRPHNVIGIGQNIYDKYRNVIGIWIRRILNGESITIYGDGSQIRSFSDISFYMEPFFKLMDNKYDNQIYNIGADKYISILDAAKTLQRIAKDKNIKTEIEFLEKRKEVHTAYCNHDKAKKDLNFVDNTNLGQTMSDMLEWALSIKKRPIKLMHPHYEITSRMYSYWK